MRFGPGVDRSGVHPLIWFVLGQIAKLHLDLTGVSLYVTSMRRDGRMRKSYHSPAAGEFAQAADLRRWAVDQQPGALTFAAMLRRAYHGVVEVVVEPEELTAQQIHERGGVTQIQPHIHIEIPNPVWPEWF